LKAPVALGPQFASDNNAGICPEAFAALAAANEGHAPGYGGDDWTASASDAIRDAFETDCEVFFVFNGTAANSLALSAICRNTDAIVCHAMAHINVDECGAPEFFSGVAKLLTVDTPHAKLTSDAVTALAVTPHDEHSSRPRALALTQATELGTLYSRQELERLCALAHALGMKVQLDGARFANAVASLGCKPADISWRAGGTCCAWAAPRMACLSARRSFFSIPRWRRNSRAGENRAGSSRRKCASLRRPGRA
jgi:threonine aldolase